MKKFAFNENSNADKNWEFCELKIYDDKSGNLSTNTTFRLINASDKILAITYGEKEDIVHSVHVTIATDSGDDEYVYFFNNNSLVNELGWYHLQDGQFEQLTTDSFPTFEVWNLDVSDYNGNQDVLTENLEMINTYFKDIFKFVN